jgi:integrase
LVAVAYTTLCRRSELVALVRDDLEIGADGVGTVIIRRGKGDQEGQGAVAPITPDPMRHLRAWIDAASLEAGPLFRAVLKGGRVGGPLDAGDVARIYKAMARRAGLSEADVAQISGHSTRVGASQDMLRYGEQAPRHHAGRRLEDMVARYTVKQGARSSAAARIADRRVPF